MTEPKKLSTLIAKIVAISAAVLALILVAMVTIPDLIDVHTNENKSSCINNLRLIEGAKEQWALENNKTNSDIPIWAEIRPYFGRGTNEAPKCPSEGIYTLGAISNHPTCSIPSHVLLN